MPNYLLNNKQYTLTMEVSSSKEIVSCQSCPYPYHWSQTDDYLFIHILINRSVSPRAIKAIITPKQLIITTTEGNTLIDKDFQNIVEINEFFWIITEREEQRYLDVQVKKQFKQNLLWNNSFIDFSSIIQVYTWKQDNDTVLITFPIQFSLRAKEIKVEVSEQHLKIITLKGEIIVDKQLENPINVNGLLWTVNQENNKKYLEIILEKKLGLWQGPFKGDHSKNNLLVEANKQLNLSADDLNFDNKIKKRKDHVLLPILEEIKDEKMKKKVITQKLSFIVRKHLLLRSNK